MRWMVDVDFGQISSRNLWHRGRLVRSESSHGKRDHRVRTWGLSMVKQQIARTYGYGSIPINTIFSGMNIHLPAILMFTRGTRFWHTAIWWWLWSGNSNKKWLAEMDMTHIQMWVGDWIGSCHFLPNHPTCYPRWAFFFAGEMGTPWYPPKLEKTYWHPYRWSKHVIFP